MKHWRKIVLGILLLGVLIAGLPWLLVRLGNLSYPNDPGTARNLWTAANFISLYDRDVILFNIGNTHYKQQQFDPAVTTYTSADAIAQAKNQCPIRYNWGLSLEQKGDAAAGSDPNSASAIYAEALRVISINTCQNDPLYRDKFEALYKRLLEKLKKLQQKPQEGQEQTQGGTNTEEAEKLLKDAEQELQEAKDYKNQKRFYDSREDEGQDSTFKFNFVW